MFDKIDDILELVQDFDFEKVKETVDAVWDQKDEIGQAVEFVVDNKDKIVEVITQLPKLLDKTGQGIAAAGESAVKASALLTGDESESAVSGLTDLAAGALDRCRKQLAAASKVLEKFGDEIDDFKIPSVSPEYTEVMGFKVITGLDINQVSPADKAAGKMREGATHMTDIATDFEVVAEQLRQIGDRLDKTGRDLNDVGGTLATTGTTLQGLANLA
jgi:hypothetical protein